MLIKLHVNRQSSHYILRRYMMRAFTFPKNMALGWKDGLVSVTATGRAVYRGRGNC